MSTALYVVIYSQDSWWIDLEGKSHGPYATREAASADARKLGQITSETGRRVEVHVPDDSGRHLVLWASPNARYARREQPSRRDTASVQGPMLGGYSG